VYYACHAFLYFQYKDGNQTDFFGHENIYLIKAESPDEALAKGRIRAQQDEGDDDGSLRCNGRPARYTLASILKVVECIDLDLETDKPVHGTELSYSDFTVVNRSEFEKLIAGQSATVIYHGASDDDKGNSQ
jgi:hypothetical protein